MDTAVGLLHYDSLQLVLSRTIPIRNNSVNAEFPGQIKIESATSAFSAVSQIHTRYNRGGGLLLPVSPTPFYCLFNSRSATRR